MKPSVHDYYQHPESKIGYQLFLRGAQHFGIYDKENVKNEWDAQKRHHEIIHKNLGLIEGSKILDLGCGRGIVATDLANRFHHDITGIDLVPYIVEEAIKNSSKQSQKPRFLQGSYQEIPFSDNTFDGAYTAETLSHSPDLVQAIKEIKRVVKPGGRCVFFEYRIERLEEMTKNERHYYELVRDGSSMSALDDFTGDNFEKLLISNGFKNVRSVDYTATVERSFRRLYLYALIPYFFIKLFGVEKKFINTTAGVEYFRLAKRGYLRYYLHTAEV